MRRPDHRPSSATARSTPTDVTSDHPRRALTERHLGWGRIAAGASLLLSLVAEVLYGYAWFELAVAGGGLVLIGLGAATLLATDVDPRTSRRAAMLPWADTAIFGLLVVAGPDEDAGYTLVLLILLLTISALRGSRAWRTAVAVGAAAEVVRQGLRPLVDRSIEPLDALIGVGLAVGLTATLARVVEIARASERAALESADAATRALDDAERAAAQLDVLHRVVVSTIGSSESDALQQIVHEVADYLDVPATTVLMLDGSSAPRVVATTDPTVAERDDVSPIRRGPFLVGPLARALTGESTRATPEERAAMSRAGEPTHDDLVVHPLRRADGTVVGALACGARRGRTFTATERRTIARIADQMSLAIEAARALRAEAELATQYRDLDRMKTDFVAITSHELRTPLTTVLGVIATMRQRGEDLGPAEARRLVTALGRQAERLSRLVDDLGTVSRVDAGTLVTVPRPVAVGDTVREAVLGLPGIDVSVRVADDLPAATADPDRLLQVVTNLLANGDQHGQGTVHVDVDHHGDEVVVRVWDEGPGVPAERRDEVFERFVRLGETRTHHHGSGLGLAIARELMLAMGGAITIVDHGDGSAFELRLPVATRPARERV